MFLKFFSHDCEVGIFWRGNFIRRYSQKSDRIGKERSLQTGEISRHPVEKNGGPWVSIRGRSEKLIELQVAQDNVTILP